MSQPAIHWEEAGDPAGAPVVFAHALGLDLTMWDAVLPLLPPGLRLLRYDLRGHGRSAPGPGSCGMGALVADAERMMAAAGVRDAVFVGLSVGGLVAQGLAAKRLDLVRGLVLSNTAAKIGTRALWQERAALVRDKGMAAVADAVLARWFAPAVRTGPIGDTWRARLLACPPASYAAVAEAIGGADFIASTSALRLPVLAVAGGADGSVPPDMVRELAGLVPGARFELIRRAGHLPPVDAPEAWAAAVGAFLRDIGQAPAHRHGPACGPTCGHG